MDSWFALKAIACMAVVTFALRGLPFLGASRLHRFSLLLRLGRFLPPAIMVLLLLHSVYSSAADHDKGLWPAVVAAAAAMLLQWRIRQPFLSILAATCLYIALIHGG